MSEQLKIYVNGVGGLGNCLFQIAAAIYYAEKYNYQIVLNPNSRLLLYGTSNSYGKRQCKKVNGKDITYDQTIFKNFKWDSHKDGHIIYNVNFEDKKLQDPKRNIFIQGYCQNKNLFLECIDQIPKYLNLNDESVIDYLKNKYPDLEDGVCIGLRIGRDFAHMKRLKTISYKRALDTLKNMGIDIGKLFIISDVPNAWKDKFNLQEEYPAIDIREDDISQFYVGMICKHYILSESTFHLWIAYMGTRGHPNKKVVCFKNSDITNRKLELDDWIQIHWN